MKKLILPIVLLTSAFVWVGHRYIGYHIYDAAWASQPYEYMFDSRGEQIAVVGERYGQFGGGMKGLIMYSGVKDALVQYMNTQQAEPITGYVDFYSFAPLEWVAQIPPFMDGKLELEMGLTDDFLHYNPEFIAWGIEAMLPDPDEVTADGPTWQEVYNVVGKRFVHMLAESHQLLESRGISSEAASYKQGMEAGGFDAYAWASERRADLRPIDEMFSEGSNISFDADEAYTWWVRRSLDGTEAQIWKSLLKVIKAYEKPYYREVK